MTNSFRLFLTGQLTSAFGSVFTTVALPLVAIRRLDASPAEVGLLAAAASVPLLTVGVVLGAWADRFTRPRRYLIASDVLAAGAVGAVALALVTGHLRLWILLALALVLGGLTLVIEALYFAHLRSLVGDDDVMGARARLQGGEQMGGVLGKALFGPAAAVSLAVPFVVDFVSYVVSAACLWRIPEPERERPPVDGRVSLHELGAGFAELRRERFLRRCMPLMAGQQLAAAMALAMTAPFLLTVLDVPTAVYGLVFVAVALAGLAGTGLSIRLVRRMDAHALTRLGFAGAAVAMLVLPLAGGPLPVAVGVAAVGIGLPYFFGSIANIGLTGFVTTAVPEQTLGRLTVSLQIVSAAAQLTGALIGGLVAASAGIRASLWIAAALSLSTLLTLPAWSARGRSRRLMVRTREGETHA